MMHFEIPILVQPQADEDEPGLRYLVRPLFFDEPTCHARQLGRAISRLTQELSHQLTKLGEQANHEGIAAYSFSPDVTLHWPELLLDLKGDMFRGRFPIAAFRHLGGWVAFCPQLPDAWFTVERKEDMKARAAEFLTDHLRRTGRQLNEEQFHAILDRFAAKKKPKKPWIALAGVHVSSEPPKRLEDESRFASLGGQERLSGREELGKIGSCLYGLYPNELRRAVHCEALVEELARLLSAPDWRPVLLVGPPLVGKTALIHECVFRDAARREERPWKSCLWKRQIWLFSSQRLVTGMSYVGQWENRLLAVLDHARQCEHVLYFDDFLGLFHAGLTASSNLCAANVLKPYVERREVRVLAEMTAEQLRVFRERDRGFADMFHVLPVEEPDEATTLRILLAVVRDVEARHRVRLATDVLPTVLDLTRRYQREAAYPGKAARWLTQLAVKYENRDVTRDDALAEFRAKSGLEIAFLDTRAKLKRQDVLESLQRRIIGQQTAVEAMTDVVSIAKARLNDPQKPLGSLFFLGPTGVGKTESAKALAHYLFGDASRLVRFDMNECVSPQSVAQLVGTSDQPEGLLTSAIRRQPFAVLLFDEIEKAHPGVFDLLLQILGEARLTDALGRTADFSNAVIILTSNLGTREAARDTGFGSNEAQAEAVYRKAVEQFFRPEFYNRLDRIVPFRRLDRGELERIARAILEDVLGREGLTRRKCALEVDREAVECVLDRGYHPTLGARAMRRAVEGELVRPMARQLAGVLPDTPTILQIGRSATGLSVEVFPLAEAEPMASAARPPTFDDPQDVLARARAALDRIQQACEAHRPNLTDGGLANTPERYWYLAIVDHLKAIRAYANGISEDLLARHDNLAPPMLPPKKPRSKRQKFAGYHRPRHLLKALYTAQDLVEFVRQLAAENAAESVKRKTEDRIETLLEQLAIAELFSPCESGWPRERVLALIRHLSGLRSGVSGLTKRLMHKFRFFFAEDINQIDFVAEFGLDATLWRGTKSPEWSSTGPNIGQPARTEEPLWWDLITDDVVRTAYCHRYFLELIMFEGPCAHRLLQPEQGTHLVVTPDGRIEPIQLLVLPLGAEGSVEHSLVDCLAEHERCRHAARSRQSDANADPLGWKPTVAIYRLNQGDHIEMVADLRAGLQSSRGDLGRPAILLPLPPEFGV